MFWRMIRHVAVGTYNGTSVPCKNVKRSLFVGKNVFWGTVLANRAVWASWLQWSPVHNVILRVWEDVKQMAANEEDQGNCNARISPPKLRPTFLLKREGNYSLFCLPERNCIRRAAVFIVKSRYPFYADVHLYTTCFQIQAELEL